jgi:hypothetical protein
MRLRPIRIIIYSKLAYPELMWCIEDVQFKRLLQRMSKYLVYY